MIISISFYILFKPEIWFSNNNIDNLINVNPVENISLLSALNYPNPDFACLNSAGETFGKRLHPKFKFPRVSVGGGWVFLI